MLIVCCYDLQGYQLFIPHDSFFSFQAALPITATVSDISHLAYPCCAILRW